MGADKSCDGCAMCCFLLGIEALGKPRGHWCVNCSTRRSCDIYEDRPRECADFYCQYILDPALDDRWKPSRSKMMLVFNQAGDRLTVYVDPNRPDAWRKEPFRSRLRDWAQSAAARREQVIVSVGKSKYVVFPDRDVHLGEVRDDQEIVTTEQRTAAGIVLDAYVRDL
ncbi:MAG: hypothetical protein RIM72_08415 [Alphaproteobacteria bacterium]